VGKLFFAAKLGGEDREEAGDTPDGASAAELEASALGATHAEAGAYLMGLWGLHDPVVEAIALHHSPRKSEERRYDALPIVHVADAVAREHESGPAAGEPPEIDRAYLAELGLAERLAAWQDVCRPIVQEEMADV
jgi:HD-like signal output (HDOD) protein